MKISPVKGGEVLASKMSPNRQTSTVLPVDISRMPSQGDAELSNLVLTDAGKAAIAAANVTPGPLDKHVEVGLARWLRQTQDSTDFYHPESRRTAWDGVPETILFSLPRRPYQTAHVLFALRSDAGRQPEMTVRLARYRQVWDGAGSAYGDTVVRLDQSQQVGTVAAQIGGQQQQLNVYLAAVPLAIGELAGELQMTTRDFNEPEDFLYLELTRPLAVRATKNNGLHDWAPLGSPSGVLVLGLTLQQPAVELMVTSPQPGFVFYRDQSPVLQLKAKNPGPATKTTLRATLTDYDGRQHELNQPFDLPAGESTHDIPLGGLDLGWYGGTFAFTAGERPLWQQRVAFVLLPPDTRKATYKDSPFGIWWFAGGHYDQTDPQIALPLVKKLGIYKVTPSHDKKPEPYHQHGVFPGMMGYLRPKGKLTVADQVREYVAKFPQVEWAMIYHEDGGMGEGIGLPAELLNQPLPQRNDQQQKAKERFFRTAEAYIDEVRSVAPNMKFMIGNSSAEFNFTFLREGFPKDKWHALGMEMAVQQFHPESQPTGWNLQSYWLAEQLRKKYGYDQLAVSACYEVDYRVTTPGALTPRTQADWYTRDLLISLAYRLPFIYAGLLDDTNSSYYTSRWGASGVMERAPLMMPKPAYAAIATLTLVLDQAKYQRTVPTGSTVTQCLEFTNEQGYVYAIWTSEGRRPVTLKGLDQVTVVDSSGRRREISAAEPVEAGVSPRYVISSKQLTGVELGRPIHEIPAIANVQKLDTMSPAQWKLAKGPVDAFENWCAYSPLTPADAKLDGDGVTQVTITPDPKTPDLVGRYVTLEPANGPIEISGTPDTVAVSVHGNGNWGRVIFELTDAKGRRWVSNGWDEGPNGWDMSDWEARTSINHDGWRTIIQPLPLHYPSGYYGPTFRDWRCVGDNSVTTRIEYPVKLSKIHVILREKLVQVTEMVPATSLSVQLKDVIAGDTGRAIVMKKTN
jgi:hypothetical protein